LARLAPPNSHGVPTRRRPDSQHYQAPIPTTNAEKARIEKIEQIARIAELTLLLTTSIGNYA